MGREEGVGAADKRAHERKPCFFTDVDYALSQGVFTEPIRDISLGGVFIESDNRPLKGERVQMLFSDYSGVDLVRLSGDVVRMDDAGFAVAFACDSTEDLKKLTQYINSL